MTGGQAPARGALAGVRVLDLSRILAGPWCAQNLADLGAEVIKVERPGAGDDTRSWGPPWLPGADGQPSRDATYFAGANRGKQSVTLDIASPQGQQIVRELAAKSQIVLENYKVGDLKRYGLDYDSLKAVNPALVYCSITGYGQTGPSAHKPGYDFIFQGLGGLMSVTGERDDLPGGGPQKVGVAVVDMLTGMYATVAVLAALRHAERTGEGQHIDMALLDAVVAVGATPIIAQRVTGQAMPRYGNAHANMVPYHVFATADGYMIVAAGNDGQWQAYCRGVERPDLAADERFATGPGRIIHRDTLVPLLEAHMRTRPTAHWVQALEAQGIPCGPINDYGQVLEDPQVRHRELQVDLVRDDGSLCPTVKSPLRLSATPVQYDAPPPRLGQHTEQVLQTVLGLSAERVAKLREQGVV
ncbi:putative formyl CoA transferase, L-carnitine dehydratase/bile acid-inducible protein F CoA-transferase family [Cupriavidus phytorum]|uniref:Formyl CoA transferase, L-carnitine dehydratase/bile acid-inducible protein F CoA-transferase family n=2 Tax=Cupriavidus TaxID=106589 RepID=A0A975XJX9_9BURK|nr:MULTISPECIES: CaiB/BaiF CoA-transferase family protein [Cupriavidus]PZX27071.1 crotonobetainyl-CoA:carnitine CoA-transferase CaiB-like acyl-CoA transferase [Cupriavidus alkaliphilus]SOY75156.1 putative formyl CoA transferase, L-carnitine dehydratase/bile acid-inducible protein F CoA-transferase family [Cupriavidus taiwanensis]